VLSTFDFSLDIDESLHQSHLLPIEYNQIEGQWQREQQLLAGLLLQPTGRKKGQFYRRAKHTFLGPDCDKVGAPNWTTLQNEDWLGYVEFDGVSKYTISIV